MSLLKPLFRILFVLSILTLTAILSRGQGVPWYTIPLPIPNGFVDAATGNVHLEIPIGSVPQRNGDPLVANVVYDSTQYVYNSTSGMFSSTGLGFRTIAGTAHSGAATISVTSQSCPPGWNGNVQVASNPSFVDNHGTTHAVVNANLYTRQYNCSANGTPYGTGSDITSFSGSAADGSGYTFQVSNYTNLQVRSADGWLVYDNTGANGFNWPKDTNGNYVQSAVAGMPDTLNRSLFQIGFYTCASATKTITVRASDGSTQTYTFTCTPQSVAEFSSGTQFTHSINFLTGIALPDGTNYSFTYDTGTTGTHLGGLLSVTLPTGGTIIFAQVPGVPNLGATINLPGRTASATFWGGTSNLSYSYNTSTGVTTTTVLSPSRYDSASNTNVNDKTVFTSVPFNPYVQTAQYYNGSSTLLRTAATTYDSNGNFLPVTVTTTLNDTGQSSSVSYQYFNLMRNYPTQKQETDFTGAVVRTTTTAYNPSFMKPTSVNVYAGTGTGSPVASTLYTYDEYTANYCKNGVPGLTGVTGATGHDDAYSATFYSRGNVTTTQRLISGTAYSTTHACYDTLGNVTQTVDANGNPTSYDYSENWTDANCIPAGTLTHAFPTTITDALGHRTKKSYFTCTSLTQSIKDENDIQAGRNGTTYTFDLFNRPLAINYPDTGQTTYCYSHDPNSSCYTSALPPFSTESRLMSGTTSFNTKTLVDSYGRVSETQITSDPDCASGDKTDTSYDNLGRVLTVSNSYCSTGDPTYGLTTYAYDALGRTTQATEPDGSTVLTTYRGGATQVQDEGNGTQRVTRISQVDGLGRLTSVCEVSNASLIGSAGTPAACGQDISGTGFLTTYQYDALDNLLQVNQSGIAARTFSYDSLSHLLTASNPESGTISYAYDANGNLITKTDAIGINTTYSYDALNRLTEKSYDDGITPTATFTYDCCNSNSTNLIGRLYQSAVGSQTYSYYSYDPMGRIVYQYQGIPNAQNTAYGYSLPYTYDLVGNITAASDGRSQSLNYTYTFNSAARLTSLTFFGSTYLSGVHYDAAGRLTSDTLGNGETETWSYNNRGWPVSSASSVNGSNTYSYNITSFAPNGDILAASDSVNGNWTYSYDPFNRLVGANQNNGQAVYSYVYDRFGNRWQQNGPNSMQLTFTGNNPANPQNNNQMDGYPYDANGNLLNDGNHEYFYDAENRLVQVDGDGGYCSTGVGAAATACYFYDANGNRVRDTGVPDCNSISGLSGGMGYTYDLSGHRILEVNTDVSNGSACADETFAGNRHLVRSKGVIAYSHSDWLGTERARVCVGNCGGYNQDNCTSLPFGDALSCTFAMSSAYVSPMHFTGKPHDLDTGLDNFGARYNSSSFGRFMSPDPENAGAEDEAPQSWNAYSYVLNNPLNAVDPDGRDCLFITENALQLIRGDCLHVPNDATAVTYVPGKVDEKSLTYDSKTGRISYSFTPYDTKTNIGRGQICCLKELSVFQLLLAYRETDDPDFKRYLIGKILGVQTIPIPVAPGQNTVGPPTGGLPVPLRLLRVLKMIDAAGSALPGAQGGRQFMNDGRLGGEVLPQIDSQGNPITYREWDVNPTQPGGGRDAERIVTGSDGSAYYTPDHYRTFKKLR